MAENVIQAVGLTKHYKATAALDHVNICVGRGEIYGLVGDNGAGKTTFLKLVAGQIFASEGELTLFGAHLPRDMEKQRKRTGAVIEAPGFYPQLTVRQNLEYYRIQKGIPGKKAVDEALEVTGLSDRQSKLGRTLSMGMKQRLGLAVALMGEPELLILDEPINGLDPSGIIEIRNLLHRLSQERGMTILLSSHILTELEQLATVYGFLDNGLLLEQIDAEALRDKCTSYVVIQVSDPERYTVLLEKSYPSEHYQVMPDGIVHINKPQLDISEYGRLAGENGLGISRLDKYQMTLEEYYMNSKKGGSRHA